jgi:hypothetical protein
MDLITEMPNHALNETGCLRTATSVAVSSAVALQSWRPVRRVAEIGSLGRCTCAHDLPSASPRQKV